MKKTSLLVLLLCACLLLTACTATDPDNLFEMPEGSTVPSGAESIQTDPVETESTPSESNEGVYGLLSPNGAGKIASRDPETHLRQGAVGWRGY